MKKYYFEDYRYLVLNPVNVTFYELLKMDGEQFKEWLMEIRDVMLYCWDKHNTPPGAGVCEDEIIKDFKHLSKLNISGMLACDDESGKRNCIVKSGDDGSTCNQFFPHLLRTGKNTKDVAKIIKKKNAKDNGKKAKKKDEKVEGISLYDNLKKGDWTTIKNRFYQNFKKDSFKQYSKPIPSTDECQDGVKFVKEFRQELSENEIWFDSIIVKKNELMIAKKEKELSITKNELETLGYQPWQIIQKDYDKAKDCDKFKIRMFNKDTKLFPKGFPILKRAFDGVVTNFPPSIAKMLYTKYTEPFKHQDRIIIYDCSAGWGGRIMGAMSVHDRNIHYVGTDPNSANFIKGLNITRYEYVADFYNRNVKPKNPNTFEIFRCGSEVIDQEPEFQKYKGKIDLVFTSPPYFSKEVYNKEKTQSCQKFIDYGDSDDDTNTWRIGYLKRTLEICCEYLKIGGVLLWNISDVEIGGKLKPLEKDSCSILYDLGMTYVETLRMVLKRSPGANRETATGLTTKNMVSVGGKLEKYEPIFVFRRDK